MYMKDKDIADAVERIARDLFNSFVMEYPGYTYHSPTLKLIGELRELAELLKEEL